MNIRKHLTLFVLTGLLFGGAAVFAQEQTSNGAHPTWRINVKGADIHEFVEQVATITGRTFVIDPRLKGNVTVISNESMDADAVYALFLQVLRSHGFTASASGDVIRIQQTAVGKQTPGAQGRLSDVAPGELVTRVIAAQNVASTELVKILRPLIPQYGHIGPIEQPNVVIITDHADNIDRLRRIIQQIDVSDEDMIEMVPLKEAWVGSVVALLEKLAPDQIGRNAKGPQRVQILANERNNSLVLKGKPRPIAEVLKLVDKLDQPATTTGSTQVIRLKHADAVQTAEAITALLPKRSGEEGAEDATIHADESLNAIVVRADPGTMNEILDVVAQLDVRRSQVLIEAAIVEVRVEDRTELGVEMAGVDAGGSSLPLASTALSGTLQSLLAGLIPEDGEINDTADISPLNALNSVAGTGSPTLAAAKIDLNGISFGAVLTAIATNTDANLLSTPSVMTMDNQEAKIVVGREVPFRTGSFTTNTDGASNPFTTVNREDVGLQLTVTPHVHDGTSVRMKIAQEITSVVESATVGSSAFADIVTSKREIDTTVLASHDETIVLGGLIQDNVTDTQSKVPLLGDIPVLGRLFRRDSQTRERTNLLVFLRPSVINTGEEAEATTQRKYGDIWEVEINSTDSEIDELFKGKNPAR